MMKKLLFLATLAVGLAAQTVRAQHVSQYVELKKGWNAIYLEVTPDDPSPKAFADLFASESVRSIGCYLPDAADRTRQINDDGTSKKGSDVSVYSWSREGEAQAPAQHLLESVCGGKCYLINAANDASATVTGIPALPRMRWRDTSPENAQGAIVGVSTKANQSVLATAYFGEGPYGGTLYTIGGTDASATFSAPRPRSTPTVVGGKAYGVTSGRAEDWPGVVDVGGLQLDDSLTFVPSSSEESFTVRNAGTKERTLRIELVKSVLESEKQPTLLYFDASATNGTNWVSFSSHDIRLAAGAKRTVYLALDRTGISGPATESAVIAVSDLDGGTAMQVRFPVVAYTAATDSDGNADWPNGIWIGRVSLTKVSFGSNADPVAAGGAVNATVLMRVKDGKASLLQRLVISEETDTNKASRVRLTFAHPGGADTVRRVSCVLMDPSPSNRVVGMTPGGEFGGTVRFQYTIDEASPVNPFRHTWHPDHDGLVEKDVRAPSGDVLANYAKPLKPELWSVTNTVTFAWDGDGSKWIPEAVVGGTVTWKLEGLRAKTPIVCSGGFALQRVCAITKIEDEEN